MKTLVFFLGLSLVLEAQTMIYGGRVFKGAMDASGASSTVPYRTGSGSPASRDNCAKVGETYFQTDAAPGANVWNCTAVGAPGSWSQAAGSGATVTSGTSAPAGTCSNGALYVRTDMQQLYVCSAANTWKTANYLSGLAANRPADCAASQLYLATDTGALSYCAAPGTPGTWSPVAAASGLTPPGSNGIVVASGGTSLGRSIAAGAGITVANGDGIAGNPTPAIDTAVVMTHTALHSNPLYCADASSSGDDFSCNLATAMTSYSAGSLLWFRPNQACSGAATIAVNGLGAKSLTAADGLSAPGCLAGRVYPIWYDGSEFRIAGLPLVDEATQALTGDSATGFFPSGQIEAARGGTGVDSSAATGIPHVANGAWTIGAVTDADIPDTITASNYLPLAGGALSGQLVTSNLGIDFSESDTNPPCTAGNFSIYADLSENKLKKCQNGSSSDLDTGASAVVGSDTQVTFNDGGTLSGDAGLTYNKTTKNLTVGAVTTAASGIAGAIGLLEGTACNPASNEICLYAPSDVTTAYGIVLPAASATGLLLGTNSSNVNTLSFVGSSIVGQVLRVGSGPTIAFGALDLADSDAIIGTLADGNIASKYKTRELVFMLGADGGPALTDTDDQPTIFWNRLGNSIHIAEVGCESDSGTPSVNLQKDDGSPTDVLSSNLSCSTSGAISTSFTSGEDAVASGDKIDFKMVTAGGAAKRVTVTVKYTVD